MWRPTGIGSSVGLVSQVDFSSTTSRQVACVEQDNISTSEVVRNEADVQKTDANATEPVKVTYADAVKGKTENKQAKKVKFVSPLTLKI